VYNLIIVVRLKMTCTKSQPGAYLPSSEPMNQNFTLVVIKGRNCLIIKLTFTLASDPFLSRKRLPFSKPHVLLIKQIVSELVSLLFKPDFSAALLGYIL